jgi:hypothetical protein
VTGVEQVGLGVMGCGIPFGDDACILAILAKAAVAIYDGIHRLIGGISKLSSYAALSMAYYSCMRRADFLAGAIPPRLMKYFCVCIRNGSPRRPFRCHT